MGYGKETPDSVVPAGDVVYNVKNLLQHRRSEVEFIRSDFRVIGTFRRCGACPWGRRDRPG